METKSRAQIASEIIARRDSILEQFTQAYIAHTRLGLDDIQLVQRQVDGAVEWNFEPKHPQLKTVFEQNLEAKIAKLVKGLVGLATRKVEGQEMCWCPPDKITVATGHTPICTYIRKALE